MIEDVQNIPAINVSPGQPIKQVVTDQIGDVHAACTGQPPDYLPDQFRQENLAHLCAINARFMPVEQGGDKSLQVTGLLRPAHHMVGME
jgi:hypothetical protein